MATKLTRLAHKIPIQLQVVAESCTICSSRSRWQVRKLMDTPSYLKFLSKCSGQFWSLSTPHLYMKFNSNYYHNSQNWLHLHSLVRNIKYRYLKLFTKYKNNLFPSFVDQLRQQILWCNVVPHCRQPCVLQTGVLKKSTQYT
jgi:hypothetical protein